MDGLTIARERIAREAKEKTGVLDLGMLDLSELPEELFALRGLRRLNLGSAYFDEKGVWRQSASRLGANNVAAHLGRLAGLPSLDFLSLFETDLANLTPLKDL